MAKIITAAEAAALIENGSTVASSGIIGALLPEALYAALEQRFLETGEPRNLTLMHCGGNGNSNDSGANHLAHEGLLKRVIGGHYNVAPKIGKLAVENKCEAYNFPQGTLSQWFRAIAGKKPGVITKVGLNTFVDPRIEGGKVNSVTKEDLVEVLELNGEEWLWFKPAKVDYAIVRGTTADENGNITMEREAVFLEALPQAQAAKTCGGKVIVQVERIVQAGTLNPKDVKIPGISVDYIVVADPAQHMQTAGEQYNPSYSGEVRVPLSELPPMPLDMRKVIARRAAMELIPGAIVNLGIGMPEGVAMVANEEGVGHSMTLTVESGPIGGVPAGGQSFGASSNAQAILDQTSQFDFYDGGGVDLAYLGLAETDKHGNINVSKFKGRVAGCGGFINITQNAKKCIYCGGFTAGGLKVKVADGKLTILTEGKQVKFLDHVEQITFSGQYAQKTHQPVLYITERAVFALRQEGMTLIEIAPGVDLEKDILNQMEFKPLIAENLKLMDARIFHDEPMGLK